MREPKYEIGDVVLLLNGKIRKIQMRESTEYEDWTNVQYQGKWYQVIFKEEDVASLLKGKTK